LIREYSEIIVIFHFRAYCSENQYCTEIFVIEKYFDIYRRNHLGVFYVDNIEYVKTQKNANI